MEKGAERLSATLGREALFGLANSAGIAVPGPLLQLPIAELRRQLEVSKPGVE